MESSWGQTIYLPTEILNPPIVLVPNTINYPKIGQETWLKTDAQDITGSNRQLPRPYLISKSDLNWDFLFEIA